MSRVLPLIKITFISLLISFLVFASACGGGGGGDSFSGAGTAFISLQPGEFDVGDRARVEIEIFDVNMDGVIVKVRMPDTLDYVPNTASLRVDGDDVDEVPDVNTLGDDDDRFIVFFIEESEFSRDGSGVLQFEVSADDSVANGQVEVDVDVDNPDIPNPGEFDIDDPQFQEEDSASVEVIQ